MDLKIFKNSSADAQEFGTNNSFRSIGVGKDGHVWAGTANQGLFKYNGTKWEKYSSLTDNLITDIKADKSGGIWIAQAGNTGAQARGGGISYFPNSSFTNIVYNSLANDGGLPTRYVNSLYVNKYDIAPLGAPAFNVWSAHLADLTAGVSRTGAVGKGRSNGSTPFFRSITAGVATSGGTGSCQFIAGNQYEVWVYAHVNNSSLNQILRYGATSETLLTNGILDQTNTNLPAGFRVRAMHFEPVFGRWWLAMTNGEVFVHSSPTYNSTLGFQKVSFSPIFPSGSFVINNNAITSDNRGQVYIGTNDGLVVYNGGKLNEESSYRRYTQDDGLPSNYVAGVAVDGFGKDPYYVKIATNDGIAFWKPEEIKVYPVYKGKIAKDAMVYQKIVENIRIAADSSTSTYIKIAVPSNDFKIRVAEDPDEKGKELYGYFLDQSTNEGELTAYYHHPSRPQINTDKFARTIHFEVVNKTTGNVLITENVDIVRPPLLLVHGIFSDEGCFSNMKNMLVASGMYLPGQIDIALYPSSSAFNTTIRYVVAEKQACIIDARLKGKILCGKADVAGHSMGGVLLRKYLQSQNYSNDINKFMSFNSPQSGSQIANFVLHHETLKSIAKTFMGDPDGGALLDLKVNSDAIKELNSPPNLNAHKVPTHIINTLGEITDLPYIGSILESTPGKLIRMDMPIAALLVFIATNYGQYYINNTIYKGRPNDVAVPDESQFAGLNPKYYNLIYKQWHGSTSGPSQAVYDAFVNLLNEDPNNRNVFTVDGFNPPDLSEKFPTDMKRIGDQETRVLKITSPPPGTAYNIGDSVELNFSTSNLDSLLLVIGSATNQLYMSKIILPASTFKFKLPDEYIGRVNILLTAAGSPNDVVIDSTWINITTNIPLTSIALDQEAYAPPKTGYSLFTVKGLFQDGTIRNLTGTSGLAYSLATNNVKLELPNKIQGVKEGPDTLTVSYMGLTATASIEVTDSSAWSNLLTNPLPITMVNFSGKYIDRKINLLWTTSEEVNNKHFEVEHSEDASSFHGLGLVPAKGKGSAFNTYNFSTSHYQKERNYYRLKQVDIDGQVSYSDVIVIWINNAVSVSLYPNPAQHQVTVTMSQSLPKGKLQLTNMLGQIVRTTSFSGHTEKQTINLQNLNKGIYMVILTADSGEILLQEKLMIR